MPSFEEEQEKAFFNVRMNESTGGLVVFTAKLSTPPRRKTSPESVHDDFFLLSFVQSGYSERLTSQINLEARFSQH